MAKNTAKEVKKMGKNEKMDKEAAARIQSNADKTGRNQDFKERAQRAVAKHEAETKDK